MTGLVSITIEKPHYGHSNPVDEFLKQILELLKILNLALRTDGSSEALDNGVLYPSNPLLALSKGSV